MSLKGWANNQFEDTVSEGRDGNFKGKGLWSAFLKNFVDEEAIESGMQQEAVNQAVVNSGEDASQLNLGPRTTVNNAKGQINTIKRTRAADTKKTDFKNTMTATMAPITAQLAQSTQQNQLQMEMLRDDRAQRQENRADDMALRREQLQREDLRYNENVARLDRKDRKESLNTLIVGLSQLGAAFAA